MIETRRLEPNDWSLYRTLRLAALVDTPDAFGGTFADAAVRTDAYWRDRLERADPGSSHPLFAMLDGTSCALAWVMTEDVRANEAALFQRTPISWSSAWRDACPIVQVSPVRALDP